MKDNIKHFFPFRLTRANERKLMQHTLSNFLVGRQRIFQFLRRRNEINKWRKKTFYCTRKVPFANEHNANRFQKFLLLQLRSETSEFISQFFIFHFNSFMCDFYFSRPALSALEVHLWGHKNFCPTESSSSFCSCCFELDIIYDFLLAQKSVAKRCFLRLDLIQETKQREGNCLSSTKESNFAGEKISKYFVTDNFFNVVEAQWTVKGFKLLPGTSRLKWRRWTLFTQPGALLLWDLNLTIPAERTLFSPKT